MKYFASLVILLFCAGAGAQETVAVYMAGTEPLGALGSHRIMGVELEKAISRSKTYIAVNRTDEILKIIDKEQVYSRGGSVNDAQIKTIGNQLGVKHLCIVEIIEANRGYYLAARLVDVESGRNINTSTAVSKLEDYNEQLAVAKKIAMELVSGNEAEERQTQQTLPAPTPAPLPKPLIIPAPEPVIIPTPQPTHIARQTENETATRETTTRETTTHKTEQAEESRVLKKRISLEAGGIFAPFFYYNSSGYDNGYYTADGQYISDDNPSTSFGVGGYLHLDLIYVEGVFDLDVGGDGGQGLIGAFVKYPIVYKSVKVSPMLGFGAITPVYGSIFGGRIEVGITEIAYLRSEYLYCVNSVYDGGATSFKIGGGLDIGLGKNKKAYVRPELLYRYSGGGYMYTEEHYVSSPYGGYYETRPHEFESAGHSIELRAGIGYKWGGKKKSRSAP